MPDSNTITVSIDGEAFSICDLHIRYGGGIAERLARSSNLFRLNAFSEDIYFEYILEIIELGQDLDYTSYRAFERDMFNRGKAQLYNKFRTKGEHLSIVTTANSNQVNGYGQILDQHVSCNAPSPLDMMQEAENSKLFIDYMEEVDDLRLKKMCGMLLENSCPLTIATELGITAMDVMKLHRKITDLFKDAPALKLSSAA